MDLVKTFILKGTQKKKKEKKVDVLLPSIYLIEVVSTTMYLDYVLTSASGIHANIFFHIDISNYVIDIKYIYIFTHTRLWYSILCNNFKIVIKVKTKNRTVDRISKNKFESFDKRIYLPSDRYK